MSYEVIQVAAPGKYLDGRERSMGTWAEGSRGLPPDRAACLVEATTNYAHHKKGDKWVEYLETQSL